MVGCVGFPASLHHETTHVQFALAAPCSWFGEMVSCRGRYHDGARDAKAQQVPPAEQEQETRSSDKPKALSY